MNEQNWNKELKDEYDVISKDFAEDEIPYEDCFHYTDFNGLKGILAQKEIYFTEYKSLNDPYEYIFARDIIICTINNFKGNNNNEFINLLKCKIGLLFSDLLSNSELFISSFSLEPDHLPLWRWYADNGKGFSIGFNKALFTPKNDSSKSGMMGYKVTYLDKKNNNNALRIILNKLLHASEKIFYKYQNPTSNNNQEITRYIFSYFISWLIPYLAKFKDIAYNQEKEHRAILFTICRNGKYIPYPIPDCFRKVNDNRNSSRPYPDDMPKLIRQPSKIFRRAFKFDPENVVSIYVGPSFDFEDAKKKVENILKENGYPDTVLIKKANPIFIG